MPHVIVKLWPGKSKEQKEKLGDKIVQDVVDYLNCSEDSVSLAFEEIDSSDWAESVYRPEIEKNWDKLHKKPGYTI